MDLADIKMTSLLQHKRMRSMLGYRSSNHPQPIIEDTKSVKLLLSSDLSASNHLIIEIIVFKVTSVRSKE